MLVDLNNENFEREALFGLKLVDFYTTWCSFCKKQENILKDLSNNGFWIGGVDCEKNSEISKKFNITGFPTMILFKNGKEALRLVGFHDKNKLLNKLTSHL